MMQVFYSAVSGLTSSQNGLGITANNLANGNSVGYQTQRADFADRAYRSIASEEAAQAGTGTKLQAVSTSLSDGTIQETGETCDVAVEGNGYFAVQDGAGNVHYTKAGDFKLSPSNTEGGPYLVTGNGDRVLDQTGKPIRIPDGKTVQFAGPSNRADGENGPIRLGVYSFSNPAGLSRDGDGLLSATAASGRGTLAQDATVRQGALVSSNVDVAAEMGNLIQAQRGYQLNAQMVRTADELEQTANTLRQ